MVISTLFAALSLVQQPATIVTVAPEPRVISTAFSQSDKRVSLKFDGASLKDVLGFLRKQKIDFVVDPDQFKDRKLSLSLNDVPSNTALSAIASALDAHWEMVNGVRILKKGTGGTFGFQSVPGRAFSGNGFAVPQFKSLDGLKSFEGFDGKAFEFKGLNDAQRDEVRKALESARKEMANQRIEMKGLSAAQGEKMKKMLEMSRGQIELQQKALGGAKARAFVLNGQNFEGLLKSLTPAQKELQKKQGYLKISDLTPEQKKMAGISGEGTIEISISRDGETLKIKSN